MEKIHTHYDNLKVTRNAPQEVIKAAYRAMAQKYHPDINSAPDAVRVMKLVNEAWSVLSDPKLRVEHDRWIATQELRSMSESKTSSNSGQTYKAGDSHFTYPKSKTSSAQGAHTRAQHERTQSASTAASSYGRYSDASEGYKVAKSSWGRFFQNLAPLLTLANETLRLNRGAVGIVFALILIGLGYWATLTKTVQSRDLAHTLVTKSEAERFPDPPKPEAINPYNFFPIEGDPSISPSIARQTSATLESRPANGYVKGDKQIFDEGSSTFQIDNKNGSHDAEVRLYLNGRQVRSIFVRVGTIFTAKKLGPGIYKMKYRIKVNGEPKVFQAKDDFLLSQTVTRTDEGISTRFSRVTVTLYKVKDGNMQTEEIPIGSF